MAQISVESLGKIEGDNFIFDKDKLKDAVVNYKVGSILNSPGEPLRPGQWNSVVEQIQNEAKLTPMKNSCVVWIG